MEHRPTEEPPEKKGRTTFTVEVMGKLEGAYQSGMKSKGKTSDDKVAQLTLETGLSSSQIKDWIGNKSRKESGRRYKPKLSYRKDPNAYNVFCKDQSAAGVKDLGAWSERWKGLGQEGQDVYKQKAKESSLVPLAHRTPQDKKKLANCLLKDLDCLLMKLSQCGVDLACIGHSLDNQIILVGHGRCLQFLEETQEKFSLFMNLENNLKLSEKQEEEVGSLRKLAQDHFNNLYSKSTNSTSKFPYAAAICGKLIVEGIPDSLLPLRLPSHCGRDRLKEMLAVKEITVHVNDSQVDSSASDVGRTMEKENEGIIPSSIDDNILPNTPDDQTSASPVVRMEKENEDIYTVEEILNHRRKGKRTQYQIKWKHYKIEDSTWEEERNILDKTLIKNYLQKK